MAKKNPTAQSRHAIRYDESDRETEAFWWGLPSWKYEESRHDAKGFLYSRDYDQNIDDERLPGYLRDEIEDNY